MTITESVQTHTSSRPSRAQLIVALIERDGDECYFCHRDFAARERTIDHWMPQIWCKENGWSYEKMWALDNLKLACKPCNAKKGDLIPNEDGTIPKRKGSTFRYRRDKRGMRAEICTSCNAGRNLDYGDVCAACNSGPMPMRYPRWAKMPSAECDHEAFWCWACSIGLIPRAGATEMLFRGEGEEEGLLGE